MMVFNAPSSWRSQRSLLLSQLATSYHDQGLCDEQPVFLELQANSMKVMGKPGSFFQQVTCPDRPHFSSFLSETTRNRIESSSEHH